MSKLPDLKRGHNICVICEGNEEKYYMDRLKDLGLWSSNYRITMYNAKSASNIPARFQDIYQNDRYEVVLIFCDTDNKPYKEYTLIKRKIDEFFDKNGASKNLIIFANPCTMQIILSHFGEVELKSHSKRINAPIIQELTGIVSYGAHEDQIKSICNKINRKSYGDMKERVKKINFSDTTLCSTNFSVFLENVENTDTSWINSIIDFLES